MRYVDLLELAALSAAAAEVLGTLRAPAVPPRYVVLRAVNAAAADTMVQGPAREQLGRWLQTHRLWLAVPSPPERRTVLLQIRLTPDELARLKHAAQHAGVDVSTWVRQRALPTSP